MAEGEWPWGSYMPWAVFQTPGAELPSCSQEADVKAETHIGQGSPTTSASGPHHPAHFDAKLWFVCVSHMAPIYTPPLHWDSLWKILGGSPVGLSWFFPAPLHLEPCQDQSPVVPTRTLPSPPPVPSPSLSGANCKAGALSKCMGRWLGSWVPADAWDLSPC